MPHIADDDPTAHGAPLDGVLVREATPIDLGVTASLEAEREGCDVEACRSRQERRLQDPEHRLFVVEVDGDVQGYGWVSYLRPVEGGGHGAPDGWYLSGLVVAPHARRQGLGHRLTEARIAWVRDRAGAVYYVVSESNGASLRLHESFGMRELTRDFALPGVVFGRNDGILCSLEDRPDADVIDLETRRSATA